MFQTASGVTIPFPEKIHEEYQIYDTGFTLNLSFEKLKPFVDEFIEGLSEPLFLVLEFPLSQYEEEELRKSNTDSFHKKVCYLDGQSKVQIQEIMQKYGELLLNDGMSQFAVYSHGTMDGVYVQKYKIVSIYGPNPPQYLDFLHKYGVVETDKLLTVWNTFTHETPGEARTIKVDGIDCFQLFLELEKLGMYVAKIVED